MSLWVVTENLKTPATVSLLCFPFQGEIGVLCSHIFNVLFAAWSLTVPNIINTNSLET